MSFHVTAKGSQVWTKKHRGSQLTHFLKTFAGATRHVFALSQFDPFAYRLGHNWYNM